MKGVIMAGGKGTRLRPLTCHLPKPMVPLVEKPMMEYTIEWLKRFGITDIAVTIHYLRDCIKDYFGDGRRFGVHISYFEEQEPLGTAGSIKNASSFIDDTFIVISGDALTDFHLSEALEFHQQRGALATILMSREREPLDYGEMIIDQAGRVKQLLEKPGWDEVYSDFVNTGIYIFEPEILHYIEADTPSDFSSDVFPHLLQYEKPLYGYAAKGYWLDIGTFQQYRQAHIDILNKKVNVSLKGEELFPHVWVGEHVQIEDGAMIIGPAFIGDGAVIRKHVKVEPYSVIGEHVQVNEYTSIKRSIICSHGYIGKHCELRGSIVANGTYMANSVELLDDSVIGSRCVVQSHVRVKPNVKIWPKKVIFEGATVHSSIFWGKQIRRSLFTDYGICGIANIEISPESASKLACAYGSTLPLKSKVIVASDGQPFADMIKQSIIQGLHSTGINTIDCLDPITAPIVRYQLSQSSYDGGIFISINEQERKVYIDVYDQYGYPIDRKQERNIEMTLAQEQLRRVPVEQLGESEYHQRAFSRYTEALCKHIYVPLNGCKVILAANAHIHHIAKELVSHVGEGMISIHDTNIDSIREYVRTMNVKFAFVIQNNGEQFTVIDEKGDVLTEMQLLCMYTMTTLLFQSGMIVPIPNYAPSSLETIARELNGNVRRMNGKRRDMLLALSHPFHFCYDALYAFIQLFQLLSFDTRSLSELLASFPHVHWLCDYVSCSWSARGIVMRKLIEEALEKRIDIDGGIKVYHSDDSWAFILPKLDEPAFTIYSQASDFQKAKETMAYYINKIRQYQNA